MPRKAVLSGGRRDQIIEVAMRLFFEYGYEATSVRMIMDAVGGEIGMFYHYFKSKDVLFDQVVEHFFLDYEERFRTMFASCTSLEGFVDAFLPQYRIAMAQYETLESKMHWTIRYALHARTVDALVQVVADRLEEMGVESLRPIDLLARQLVYGVSATLHAPSFEAMDAEQQRACLLALVEKLGAER